MKKKGILLNNNSGGLSASATKVCCSYSCCTSDGSQPFLYYLRRRVFGTLFSTRFNVKPLPYDLPCDVVCTESEPRARVLRLVTRSQSNVMYSSTLMPSITPLNRSYFSLESHPRKKPDVSELPFASRTYRDLLEMYSILILPVRGSMYHLKRLTSE